MLKRKTMDCIGVHEIMVHAQNNRDAQALLELCDRGHQNLYVNNASPIGILHSCRLDTRLSNIAHV